MHSAQPKREEYPYTLPVDTLIKDAVPLSKNIKRVFFPLDQDGNSEFFDDIIGVTNYKSKLKKEIIIKVHTQDNRLKLNRAHSEWFFMMKFKQLECVLKEIKS